jgi:hypothetical protein
VRLEFDVLYYCTIQDRYSHFIFHKNVKEAINFITRYCYPVAAEKLLAA